MAPKSAKELPYAAELNNPTSSNLFDSTPNDKPWTVYFSDSDSDPAEAEEAPKEGPELDGLQRRERYGWNINKVWVDGRAFDMKEIFMETAVAVNRVARERREVDWDKRKNQWGDYKEKWKHSTILSQMLGLGWSEEREKYIRSNSET